MNASETSHPFNTDRPITVRAEDILGRSDFAKSLAEAISAWKERDSLVIGLFGGWGQGKTSVKNLVLDFLKDKTAIAPFIVEFNPWRWSSQAQIAQAFFGEISSTLGQDKAPDAAERASKWRQYAAVLSFGEKTVSGLNKAVPDILLAIAFVCGATGLVSSPAVRSAAMIVAGVAAVVAAVLRLGAGLAEDVSKFIEEKCHLTTKGPEDVRQQLKTMMAALSRPVLVVLDDIDRLSPEEIRLVFQLVKSNADFPNMVYLLLFQRDIVEKALEHCAGSSPVLQGRDYLEKIVNVGFDLPIVERAKLGRFLSVGLDKLLHGLPSKQEESDRLSALYWEILQHFLLDLRDVKRLLSSLDLHLSLLRAGGTLEVNTTDLIALEVVRVFEPGVYALLPGLQEYLTRSREQPDDNEAKEAKAAIDSAIAKSTSEVRQPLVLALLKEIFPQIQALYSGPNYGWTDDWYVDLRACHPHLFLRYFLFRLAEGDVSQADIVRILTLVGDRDSLVAELRSFNKQGLLSVLLDRLESYKEKIDLKHAVPFITAFYDIGDDIPYEAPSFFSLSPEQHAIRIIHWYLRQQPDPVKRGQVLMAATSQASGLFLPTLNAFREDRRRKQEGDTSERLADEASSESLKGLCLEKLRNAASDRTLLTKRHMQFLLHRWREWAPPTESTEWLTRQLTSQDGLLAVLTAFLTRSSRISGGAGVPKVEWRFDLKGLEQFIAPELVEQQVALLKPETLTDDQHRALDCFSRAMKRKRAGKPYDTDQIWGGGEDE